MKKTKDFNFVVAKELPTITQENGDRIMNAIISTAGYDRVNDRCLPGCFVNIQDAMPLLWSHKRDEYPLGKSISLQNTDNGVSGSFVFHTITDAAREAYDLVKGGYISQCSVSFNVLPGGFKNNARGGYDFYQAELLETSLVNVPCNADAVVTGIKALMAKGYSFSDETLRTFGLDEYITVVDDERYIEVIDDEFL